MCFSKIKSLLKHYSYNPNMLVFGSSVLSKEQQAVHIAFFIITASQVLTVSHLNKVYVQDNFNRFQCSNYLTASTLNKAYVKQNCSNVPLL